MRSRGRQLRRAGASVIALAIAGLVLVGCAGQAPPSRPDPRLIGAWHLRAGTDARGSFALDNTDITLTIGDSGHTGGRSACSRYSARVTGGIGPIFVTAKSTLSDRCQTIPSAVLDSRFLDELSATRLAALSAGTLTLSSGHGDLQFTKVGGATSLTGITWALDGLSNATSQWLASSVRGAATMRFSPDGVFVISTACATLTAQYRITGQQISVSNYSEDIGNGGICNDKTGAVGAEVMSLVGGAFSYEIRDGALLMTANGLGSSARFTERGGSTDPHSGALYSGSLTG